MSPCVAVNVALVQMPPVFLNLDASLERAKTLVGEAGEKGARIIVFPETWLPGYPVWLDNSPGAAQWDHAGAKALYGILHDNALEIESTPFSSLCAMAKKHGVSLAMGCHEKQGASLYNSQILISGVDGRVQCRRKLMPTYNERLIWGRGDGGGLDTVETEAGPMGGLICWEHWMPLARAAMHARNEVVHVAQWPSVNDLHHLASRHYAFEGGCFVLAAGTVLSRGEVLEGFDSLGLDCPEAREMLAATAESDGDLLMTGNSAVIGPDAGYVLEPAGSVREILHSRLEMGRIAEAGLVMDSAGHYSRPDIFSLGVNTRPMAGVEFSKDL